MATAVLVDVVRTPGGKRNGSLSGWHPTELAAEVLTAIVERNDLDPALVEDVIMGCVMQAGAQSLNVGTQRGPRRGVPRVGAGHHHRPPVRLVPAGRPLRRPGRHGGRPRRRDRRGGRGHEPRTDGRVGRAGGGLPLRSPHRGPLRGGRRPGPPGRLGRAHRRGVGPDPRRARRLRGPLPAAGRGRPRRGSLRPGARPRRVPPAGQGDGRGPPRRRDASRRRGHPRRHHRRDPRPAQAGVRARRQGDRGELLADHRRRVGRAHHQRGDRGRAWASPLAPGSTPSPWPGSTPA